MLIRLAVLQKFKCSTDSALTDIAQAWGLVSPSASAQYSGIAAHMRFATRSRRPVDASDKNYVCDFDGCGKSFYQKQTMRRHQREKHKEWLEQQDQVRSAQKQDMFLGSEFGNGVRVFSGESIMLE